MAMAIIVNLESIPGTLHTKMIVVLIIQFKDMWYLYAKLKCLFGRHQWQTLIVDNLIGRECKSCKRRQRIKSITKKKEFEWEDVRHWIETQDIFGDTIVIKKKAKRKLFAKSRI